MTPGTRALREWSGALLGMLASALWCASYMWPMLNPFSLDVVLKEDWAQHTLGWLFFREEPLALSWPLGSVSRFLHPSGTTLGYMDSIPWLGLLLRPWSAILPADFQYLGLWVLACSVTLAGVAARVAALYTRHWEQQAAVGVLFAAAPTLIERLMHPALCAHALIAGALALYLVPATTPSAARRCLMAALGLLTVSSATHPYIAVMVLALSLALPWPLRGQLGGRRMLIASAGQPACVAVTLAAFGYLGRDMTIAARGFGAYSANLNTFVNSMGMSRLLPTLTQPAAQYEGYCYMGAGWLALSVIALGILVLPRTRASLTCGAGRVPVWPLMAAVLMAVFALASPVRWGERELFAMPVYEQLPWLTQTLRSSGRFVWPLLYAIELTVTLCVLQALRTQRLLASALLIGALALQLYDVDAARARVLFGKASTRLYSAPEWALAGDDFEHLVMYPAEIQSACNVAQGYRADVVSGLAYLAYRQHWTFNSGYAARYAARTPRDCQELDGQIAQRQLDPHTLYVIRRWNVRELRAAGATCGRLERLTVCVAVRDQPLAAYLSRNPP